MRIIVPAILAFFACAAAAQAADIKAISSDCFYYDDCSGKITNSILISGTIIHGDSGKFREAVGQSSAVLRTVILRSRGGDVDEAMKIGRDIRSLLLEAQGPDLDYAADDALTYLGEDRPLCIENGIGDYKGSQYKGTDCVCASACFLVYVAGARRNSSYVGIHRVYFDAAIYEDKSLNEISQAYSEIKKPLQEYLETMNVPHKYADIMLQTSSKEVYVPTYPEVLADFFGWAPELEEWLIVKCNTISERQLASADKKAFQDKDIGGFIEFRNKREACIQEVLLPERMERRKSY